MKIVVDENIPLVDEFFGDFGEITRLPGRKIKAEHLTDANILLVRSVTPVNEALLAQSPVQFVGSCTIGVDHLDTEFLKRRGITWANAPGCNANGVVQYVLSAMAAMQTDWRKKTVGIIGCGNTGGGLLKLLTKLGVRCLCYDPFVPPSSNIHLVSLKQVLAADIISCHTPLTKSGPFPTYHMLNHQVLSQLKPGTLLINCCRGAVIDSQALAESLSSQDLKVVLDVWEHEPNINSELLKKASLATPHIAGYSLEGKERGTLMVYQALHRFFGRIKQKDAQKIMNRDRVTLSLFTSWKTATTEQQFNDILLSCYNIRRDDKQLRSWDVGNKTLSQHFDQLRQHYPARREYSHFNFPDWSEQSPLKGWLAVIKSPGQVD
jgi:erythronate-4-phosphate dehydrogenase